MRLLLPWHSFRLRKIRFDYNSHDADLSCSSHLTYHSSLFFFYKTPFILYLDNLRCGHLTTMTTVALTHPPTEKLIFDGKEICTLPTVSITFLSLPTLFSHYWSKWSIPHWSLPNSARIPSNWKNRTSGCIAPQHIRWIGDDGGKSQTLPFPSLFHSLFSLLQTLSDVGWVQFVQESDSPPFRPDLRVEEEGWTEDCPCALRYCTCDG